MWDPPEVVVTVPATGAYLVIDGVVHETFEEFPPYVEIEASWRQRWSVTTKTRE